MRLNNSYAKSHMLLVMAVLTIVSVALSPLLKANVTETITDSSLYNELNVIDSKTLLQQADSYISHDTLLDRATLALTIVSNRYYDSPHNPSARKNAILALCTLGNMYQVHNLDFPKTYKYLTKALQIAEEDGDNALVANVCFSLSNLYYNSDLNQKTSEQTRELMTKGMEAALKSGDNRIMSLIALGMTTLAFSEKNWGDFARYIDDFKNYAQKHSFKEAMFLIKNIDACAAYLNGDFGASDSILNEAKKHIDNDVMQGKIYELNTDALRGLVAENSGQYSKSTDINKSIIEKARKYEMTLYMIPSFNSLRDIYNKRGMPDSANFYYSKFLFLKDSLENIAGFRSVEKMKFLTEIDSINEEVAQLSVKRQEEKMIMILALSVATVILVIMLALLWNNINLKKNHRDLFLRNEENIRMYAQYKLLYNQLKDERDSTDSEIEPMKANPDNNANIEISENTYNSEIQDMQTLKRIYTRVLAAMESSKEIYNPGFSMHDLSKIVKVSPKNLSKAINVCHNANFRQLLNEFRIREVMRIIHSGEADNLTIESVAGMAGFRSRTNFSTIFKKNTGLSPSEYIKMKRTTPMKMPESHFLDS